MLGQFVQFLLEMTQNLGYAGIFFLMAVESSFIPFPSEVVVPPAAYLAYQGEMNLWLVILVGVGGSLLGASVNYFLARWLGRPVIYAIAKKKYMKYLLITHHKLEKAEKYFLKYGNISTFIGRLLPGIRQLISIPAGFAKMPFGPFLFYTFLGSGLWVPILALHGYLIAANEDFILKYFWWIVVGFLAFVLLIVAGVYYLKVRKR